eukprot:363290-Chlamydomonas_euryale.AAC.4
MSLFRTREWWHARAGPGEEFDCGSLCIANIDNDPSGTRESAQTCLRLCMDGRPFRRLLYITSMLIGRAVRA